MENAVFLTFPAVDSSHVGGGAKEKRKRYRGYFCLSQSCGHFDPRAMLAISMHEVNKNVEFGQNVYLACMISFED